MGKTLLQPKKHTDSVERKVKQDNENTSLEDLMNEMKPHLDIAAQQLLQPDKDVINSLLKKLR